MYGYGEIETHYSWRCPMCGRIFNSDDKTKLEETRKLEISSHKEHKQGYVNIYRPDEKPPHIYF